MMHAFLALSAAALAAPSSADALATTLGLAFAAAAAAAAVLAARLRRIAGTHQQTVSSLSALQEAHKALQEREQEAQRGLGERRDALQELKQEVATQRKKNHAFQEDLRKLRDELRDQTRLRIEAQNARPAFSDPVPRPEPKVAVAPPPPPPPVVEKNPELEAALAKLQKDFEHLQGTHKTLSESVQGERTAAAEARIELKKQRKRAEDYRRIDIITKSKMEVLEDRLRHMGREYYEAISELAALKGHVAPPKPRDLPPEREVPSSDDDDGLSENPDDADSKTSRSASAPN